MKTDHNITAKGHKFGLLHLEHVTDKPRSRLPRWPVLESQVTLKAFICHDPSCRPMPPHLVPSTAFEQRRCVLHKHRLNKINVLALLEPLAELRGRYFLGSGFLCLQFWHGFHAVFHRSEIFRDFITPLLLQNLSGLK